MNRTKDYLVRSPRCIASTGTIAAVQRKPLSWVRFTWDLSRLPQLTPVPEHYQIASATTEDDAALHKVFSASYLLDPVWSPAIGDVMRQVQTWLDHALESDDRTCLALRHGSRIIGAALLHLRADAEDQLAPGPTISLEYRSRGFGTLLLQHSLGVLREAGLASASGITRDLSPAAKFVYPKFGGVAVAVDRGVLAAA